MSNLPTYGRWEDVPPNLKTKTQLGREGLRPAKGQQPAALKTHWDESIPAYDLYDVAAAVPKRVPTAAQLAAIEKAKAASLAARTCRQCEFIEELGRYYRGKPCIVDGLCPYCREAAERKADRQAAVEWARGILARPTASVLILDTETTGLEGEVVELAIIDLAGEVRFNGRFRPIQKMGEGAAAVHGITAEMLANEPAWSERYEEIKGILQAAELVLIYNARFDVRRLADTCYWYGVERIKFGRACLMEWYSQWVNDWSDYWEGYRWQRLPGGDHTAVGDCRAALDVLKRMAEGGESAAGGNEVELGLERV